MASTTRLPPRPTESTRLVSADRAAARNFVGESTAVRNPVENAVWISVRWLRLCVSLWLFGALLVVLKVAQLLNGTSWFAVLLPVWFGNVVIAALQVKLVANVVSCFTGGRILSLDAYRRIQTSRRPSDMALLPVSITEDLTHLVIRGTAAVILSVPALLLFTISEVLLCAHLETGRPGLWCCVAPALVLQVVAVIQYVLIKADTWRSGAVHALGLLLTISVVRRAALEARGASELTPWPLALAPLWALNVLFLQLIVSVLWKPFTDRYELSAQQVLCCGLYLVSTVVSTAGELLLASELCLADDDVVACLWVPLGTLYFGIFCGGVAVFIVIEVHAESLLATKGFGEPLPLGLSKDGIWEPSGVEQSFELTLGILGSLGQRQARFVELVGAPAAAAAAVGRPVPGGRGREAGGGGARRGGGAPSHGSSSIYTSPPVQSDQYDSG